MITLMQDEMWTFEEFTEYAEDNLDERVMCAA
jgi:hypothetical protein